MPRVAPFHGLHWLERFAADPVPARLRIADDDDAAPTRLADITDVVCPLYDVIDEAQREALLGRHERNAVRLNPPDADPHAAAATTPAPGSTTTLERRPELTAYYYRHATPSAPDDPAVEGVMIRVLLEAGRPHPAARAHHARPEGGPAGPLRATQRSSARSWPSTSTDPSGTTAS